MKLARQALLLGAAVLALVVPASDARGPKRPVLELVASSPHPGTTNSDLAFWGRLAFQGNYDGFRVVDISQPRAPAVLADFRCRGPQNDISVWQNLVFLSVDRPQTAATCDSQDAEEPTTPGTFEGIRIVDVSNPREPRFVKGVETECGSHTHTLVPDLARRRVLLYVSSFASAGGPRCGPGRAENPLHGKISIVAVPLAAPEQAAVVATPEVRAPVFIAGRRANPTIGCHDISVLLPRRLAAVSCMTEGHLWDISNPLRPRTLARIRNRDFEFWHSATFSNDGKIVVFGDESLSSSCGSDADPDGRLWFYEVARPARPLGSFMIAPRVVEYCSVHMFNTIPLSGRSLLASGWYDGGSHVVDFGTPRRPREIAGRVPEGASEWASYWYNGAIYASDMERGLDVFSLTLPGLAKARRLPHLNPQTQEILIR